MNKLHVLIIFFIVCHGTLQAQKCKTYQMNYCDPYGLPFDYSIQSRSFYAEKGKTYTLNLVVYKEYEYSVQFCTDDHIGFVNFKIAENGGTNQVFYDNSEDNKMGKQFVASRAMPLIVEFYMPDNGIEPKNPKIDPNKGCVGILVEYYKPPKKKPSKKPQPKPNPE